MTADYLVKKVEIKFAILLDICSDKYCQQTHLTPPNIHDIVESRLRISQEGAHHLGCGLFLWYPFVVSEEKGETI